MRQRNIYLIILAFVVIGPLVQPQVLITEMLIFGIVAVASNIMIGYTGMLSFGQAMFFGIGAYVAGLLLKAGMPLIIAMPAGILFVLVLSIAVGSICVRGPASTSFASPSPSTKCSILLPIRGPI